MTFFDSSHCMSNVHCKTCRERSDVGDTFRFNLMSKFEDILTSKFECPHGRAWGFVGFGDKVEAFLKPAVHVVHRVTGVNLSNCNGCAERKGILNKLSK